MKRLTVVVTILIAATSLCSPAQAQNYPWCAYYNGLGGTNCGFTSFAQCMATVRGIGGTCSQNTQYQPPGSYRR
ncbi:MAG TPA: DUF3551 domain-containing protein [Xanthobacteraceae bacterium]|nr:DUF3551 domain-containing protein [Xanthobacteraceae bacterium]